MTPSRPRRPVRVDPAPPVATQESGRLLAMRHDRPDRQRRPPILLVPGSFSGAGIWQDNFMPALHARGFDVYAMSFTAHGQVGITLHRRGLRDFVDDLRVAVLALPRRPVLVAHSLGGLIALMLLREMTLPAAALLSPIPAHGSWRSAFTMLAKRPLSLTKLLALSIVPRVTHWGAPPVGAFGQEVPARRAAELSRQLRAESLRVLWESLRPTPFKASDIATPLHFIAAGDDRIIPPEEVERSARELGGKFTRYRNMGHTYQAEPDFERVVQDIVTWIGPYTRGRPLRAATKKS